MSFFFLETKHLLFSTLTAIASEQLKYLSTMFNRAKASPLALSVAALAGLFLWEQIDYLRKKRHLPGPSYKVPLIGSMMDSMRPTFEKYNSKWKSGNLSCVSVFNR